jgi:hypothetical protein
MMNMKTWLPILLIPSCLLLIPGLAMLLNAEGWDWDAADFIVMWLILASGVAAYKLVSARAPNRSYRMAAGIAATTGVVLVWMNAAVGLIGSEDNPANLMYAGVLAIGILGAASARMRASGMAHALAATAVAQFMVPIIAFIIWRPEFSPGVVKVLVLNFIFVLLFSGSALLFRRSDTQSSRDDKQGACA